MEKIRKRRAIFRVEYFVYAVSDLQFNKMCEQIEMQLKTQHEVINSDLGGITALAQVIPAKVRRIAK